MLFRNYCSDRGSSRGPKYFFVTLSRIHHTNMLIVNYLSPARPGTCRQCDGPASKKRTVDNVHGAPATVQVQQSNETAAGEPPWACRAAGHRCRWRRPELVISVVIVHAFFSGALREGGCEGVGGGCGCFDGAAASALPAAARGRTERRRGERESCAAARGRD